MTKKILKAIGMLTLVAGVGLMSHLFLRDFTWFKKQEQAKNYSEIEHMLKLFPSKKLAAKTAETIYR